MMRKRKLQDPGDTTIADALARAETIRFGWPGHCPDCGEEGYLLRIDLSARRSQSCCRRCQREWSFREGLNGVAVPDPAPSTQ